jgi:aryl-alcohol dehydrogenase-like predicted oxidoreductase
LRAATAADITHFDTSPYYGYGLAETDLGRFLRGQRAALTLATKIGLYPWGGADRHAAAVWARKALGRFVPRLSQPVVNWDIEQARASLNASLRRLGTDYVDVLFLHEPDPSLMMQDALLRWIESEQAVGRVRAWGVAGVAARVAPFVLACHPLAKVVQTQDSVDGCEADFMGACGRSLQLTYGYLSAQRQGAGDNSPESVMRRALERNATGAILVSTRRVERIAALSRIAA